MELDIFLVRFSPLWATMASVICFVIFPPPAFIHSFSGLFLLVLLPRIPVLLCFAYRQIDHSPPQFLFQRCVCFLYLPLYKILIYFFTHRTWEVKDLVCNPRLFNSYDVFIESYSPFLHRGRGFLKLFF